MSKPTAEAIRAELERAAPELLALADLLKQRFNARLTYLKTDRLTLGTDPHLPPRASVATASVPPAAERGSATAADRRGSI